MKLFELKNHNMADINYQISGKIDNDYSLEII